MCWELLNLKKVHFYPKYEFFCHLVFFTMGLITPLNVKVARFSKHISI